MKSVRRIVPVGAFAIFLMIAFFPERINSRWALYSETLSPNSSASELKNRSWDYPVMALEQAFQHERWSYGYGVGTASLGTQYVQRLIANPNETVSVESGFGVLVIELGILGLALWIFWVGWFLLSAWRVVRQMRGTVYFPVALSIFWNAFLVLVPFTYLSIATYQNFVTNAYFWLLAGVIFRLPKLAQIPQPVPVSKPERVMARWHLATGGR